MSDDSPPPAGEYDCPLPLSSQRWNSACYGLYWFLFYLAAPVTYVGVTHANLVKGLGFNETRANLPGACYQWCMAAPILVAWFCPQPRLIKPLLVGALVLMGVVSASVSAGLFLGTSPELVFKLIVLVGAIFGICNGTLVTLLWEIVRRGTSSALRGPTMGLAFGLGPIFACIGSVIQQMLMGREPLTGLSLDVPFPLNYAWLFGGAAPLIWLAALLGSTFVLPPVANNETAPSRAVGWDALREFFGYRPVLFAAIGYLLVYSGGNAILANVSLYAPQALMGPVKSDDAETVSVRPPTGDGGLETAVEEGSVQAARDSAEDTQGLQNLLRFGFKAVMGLALGALLVTQGPRAALVATTSLLLLGMGWALSVTGWLYLLASGLLGAGELFGAYFPNYVASASSKRAVRANIALLNLLSSGVGFASVLFGWLASTWGLRSSFYAAAGILLVALCLILTLLPSRPVPLDQAPPSGDQR